MSLPWDRFPDERGPAPFTPPVIAPGPPASSSPTPAPPATPPANIPPPERIDWDEMLDDAWPVIKEQVLGYARDSAKAVISGQTVDILHPTVTAQDVTGRELVVADAKSRSWRTLVQGLIFDVFAGGVAAVAVLAGLDPLKGETWIAFGILLLKSVVSAVISYFMRLKITPTIKTEGATYAIAPVPRAMIEEDERNHLP